MDKEIKDIRIKPYIINGVSMFSNSLIVFAFAYYISSRDSESLLRGHEALILLPAVVGIYISNCHTGLLVIVDTLRKNYRKENVKILKINQYGAKKDTYLDWYREPYSMFYKNHKVCRYKLTIQNLDNGNEMSMYMYLTYEEAMELIESNKNRKRFEVSFMKKSRAIYKLEEKNQYP